MIGEGLAKPDDFLHLRGASRLAGLCFFDRSGTTRFLMVRSNRNENEANEGYNSPTHRYQPEKPEV